MALAHGTNDAQKTMGIITLALIANGSLGGRDRSAASGWSSRRRAAIALGTYFGGWRIMRTMGTRIIKMDAAQGFSAQGAGRGGDPRCRTFLGFPISSTHAISGGVMGAGAGKAGLGGALGCGRQHRRRLAA